MARARNIKPGLFLNEYLGTCDPLEVLFFEGLWCQADREGRLECRPLRLKAQIFPYRENVTAQVISGFIANLSEQGFLTHYAVGKHEYIQINSFLEHQNPHKNEKPSEIPPPPVKTTACEVSGNFAKTPDFIGNAPASSHDSLIPYSHDSHDSDNPPPASGSDPDAGCDDEPESDAEKPVSEKHRAKSVTKARMRKDFPELTDQTIDDWITARKNKKATSLTETAWRGVVREIRRTTLTGEEAILLAAEKGWRGFEAEWYWNLSSPRASPAQAPTQRTLHSFDNVDYSKGVNSDGSF